MLGKQHFIELRNRILFTFAIFMMVFIACYIYSQDIYELLIKPLYATNTMRQMIYTNLTDALITYLKVALFAAFSIIFPLILWQIYAFIAPGLYTLERKILAAYLIISPALFITGMLLAYYSIMPLAWKFLTSFENTRRRIVLLPKIDEYLSLSMSLLFGFGAAFQLPVVLSLLSRIGLIDDKWLKRKRRMAIILIFVAAAVLTPPDVPSQICLAIPLIVLYEASIILCHYHKKISCVQYPAPPDSCA